MSLTTALSTARTSLFNTSRQTSVVSHNLANAHNADYTRRNAVLTSMAPGSRVASIQRAADEMLFRQNLQALSSWQGQSTLLGGLEHLGLAVNGVDSEASPARMIGDLQTAIQLYSATPSNRALAESAVESARQVVRTLNGASAAVQEYRTRADQEIATAVGELNGLLARFDEANQAVTRGTRTGEDISEDLDRRDAILKKIAEFVPVSTQIRGDNDMVLTTAGGTMLYETVPRVVSFQPTLAYGATTTGNPLTIDGVAVTGATSGNGESGRLAALVQLRDTTARTMQTQLDEIARGLVSVFAETDQTGGGAPALAGLFTWTGGPAMPPAGLAVQGLAAAISVNTAYDSAAGGDPARLRDGGANGAAYLANTAGASSYGDLLIALTARIDEPMAFDLSAGAGSPSSLASFSSNAISWLEGQRQDASSAEQTRNALFARTQAALSNATGVNIDDEMARLLELEHSYQASARLISSVDEMLAALMAAV